MIYDITNSSEANHGPILSTELQCVNLNVPVLYNELGKLGIFCPAVKPKK